MPTNTARHTVAGAALPARTATERLASFVAGLRFEDLPAGVRERSKDLLIDAIASALAGNSSGEVDQVEAAGRALGGSNGSATVIGRRPAPLAPAVLTNGYLVTAATVCDVHRPTLCHVTPEVVPAALAVAEREGSDGRALLTALTAGLEVTTRVGLATNYPTFRARGWHSPGVTGPFGAAVGAGVLLGLDEQRLRNALGLAGSQSAGTFAHWGSPTIKFHQGRGALSGLLAALLAQTGFQAGPDILEDPDGGLLNTYTDGGDPAALTDQLGERWELLNISLRLWPVASSIQSMVTALFAILETHDLQPADVGGMSIRLSDTVYRMHGELPWDTRFRALLSTRYVAAVVVHDRRCWLDQFTPERIGDPALDEFARARVDVAVDPSLPTNGASVSVRSTTGAVLTARRDLPKGDAADPLSRTEIVGKLRNAAAGVLPDAASTRLLDRLEHLEDLDDVRSLTADLRLT